MGDYANYHCFGFNPETIHSNDNDDKFHEEKKTMSYEVKGKTKSIKGTSRCAMCIKDRFSGKDNYYTIEVTEEREIPNTDVDMEKEYDALFNSINDVVDGQMEQIVKAVKGEN